MRVGAVDVGTDSTRLLIADVDGDAVHEVLRRSELTQLCAGLYAAGSLTAASMARVHRALVAFRDEIDAHGCAHAGAALTSAVRDARNGPEFTAEVRRRYRLDARVIDGRQEAALTFRGATVGRELEAPTVVVDVGGGSTEFVVGQGDEIAFRATTDAGVRRKTARFLANDPPRPHEVEALGSYVRAVIERAVPASVRATVASGLAATESSTWRDALAELDDDAAARVGGGVLPREVAERALARLTEVRLATLRGVPGLHPDRAPTLVAGTVLLLETMRAFGLEEIEISERDLLDGLALELAGAGVRA